jgi:hypothetical protein
LKNPNDRICPAESSSIINNERKCLQLVDSVSPKADEDLLELMVRIAENPSEWQQVHQLLRKYMISSQEK